MSRANVSGKVYLIGAGPGDPGLLTLRGAEVLGRCDVVLFDGLSNPELLRHAPDAEHICVGKHGQTRIWKQSEIVEEMIRHAGAGRVVGRLKGGDPAIFARTSEEVESLREKKIPFEIVPGITAALAAGSYAGIPVTDRRFASAVALVTGHEEAGKSHSSIDWHALARFPGTIVIYMGVTTASAWTRALIDGGKSPHTPAALIRRCSHPDQQTFHCRLDEVAARLTPASKLRPPVIVVIGEVTRLAAQMSWIEERPLHGQTVLVTRPADQVDALAEPLRRRGAEVLVQPAIEIAPPERFDELDEAIEQLSRYDTVIFSSANGVRFFLDRLIEIGGDLRSLAGERIAVVGRQTAKSLIDYHLRADLVPDDFNAASLAKMIAPDASGRAFLSVRASRGGDELRVELERAGGSVQDVIAYRHRDVTRADPEIARRMQDRSIGWVTVTSSATARSLAKLFGEDLRHCRLASLSPITSRAIEQLGLEVATEAETATMESLVEAIEEVVQG